MKKSKALFQAVPGQVGDHMQNPEMSAKVLIAASTVVRKGGEQNYYCTLLFV